MDKHKPANRKTAGWRKQNGKLDAKSFPFCYILYETMHLNLLMCSSTCYASSKAT